MNANPRHGDNLMRRPVPLSRRSVILSPRSWLGFSTLRQIDTGRTEPASVTAPWCAPSDGKVRSTPGRGLGRVVSGREPAPKLTRSMSTHESDFQSCTGTTDPLPDDVREYIERDDGVDWQTVADLLDETSEVDR